MTTAKQKSSSHKSSSRKTPSRPAGGSNAYRSLSVDRRDDVEWLTLDRPQRLNAIHPKMAEELIDYFSRLCSRHDVRVVVLRGAGRHFCAGFDLGNVNDISAAIPRGLIMQRQMSEIVLKMRRCPQPIIALVHGAVCGAGLAIALAADVRYAAEDARMNVAMARVGLTGCDMGISYFLPRAVGSSNAAELMLGGRFIDAARALRIGLVSEVVPYETLEKTAETLALEMVGMSPVGLRLTKEGLAFGIDAANLDAVVAMEDRGQVLCMGPYMQEGLAAFQEKRAPLYKDM
jgi:enoyl-CoA hydratase